MNINEYRQQIFEAEIKPTSKLVALALLQYLNRKTMSCYPSMQTIALDCGLCRNSISSAIDELKSVDLISVKKIRSKHQRFAVNNYSFPFEPCPNIEQSNEQSIECSIEQSNERSPVGQEPSEPIEPNKPIEVKENNKKKNVFPCPDGVKNETWSQWLKVRKSKGAVNTEIAHKKIINELQKILDAGLSVNNAIEEAVSNSWRGFKSEWILKNKKPTDKLRDATNKVMMEIENGTF